MLALKVTRQFEAGLRQAFGTTDDDATTITPADALTALGRLTYLYSTDRDGQRHATLSRPDEQQAKILTALGLTFPNKPKNVRRAA